LAIPEEQLVVKPNFVPDFGTGDSIRNDEFLFVGRLVEEKGIEVLLKATRILDFKLTIIGDGPLRKIVSDAALANPNINYIGYQDKISVARHLKRCKALIFPSIWYEGFPLTILEAFSTSTLVIASRLGAMAEIIQDRVNGLLFDAGDELALANKIVEVDAEPEWAERLGQNARLNYLANYTPEKNYGLLVAVYTKALAFQREQRTIRQSETALEI
jgi:glycosyltransferase involved in cell wall biosynthesis